MRVFAARECRETNFPAAEDVRSALNRSDDVLTDQVTPSSPAVRQLTAEAISGFAAWLSKHYY